MTLPPASTAVPPPCNCLALRQAARHITQFYDAALAPLGLRATQYAILMWLATSGPWSIQTLAARLVMDRTTLGRNLRPLERDGLVSIAPDPQDGRGRVLLLTPEGTTLLARARASWDVAQARFESAFGRENAAVLRAALGQVTQTAL